MWFTATLSPGWLRVVALVEHLARARANDMLAEMEINKHFSAQRQRAGDKKKKRASEAGEGERSQNDYEGNDEQAESRHSSFPTTPHRAEQHAVRAVFHM